MGGAWGLWLTDAVKKKSDEEKWCSSSNFSQLFFTFHVEPQNMNHIRVFFHPLKCDFNIFFSFYRLACSFFTLNINQKSEWKGASGPHHVANTHTSTHTLHSFLHLVSWWETRVRWQEGSRVAQHLQVGSSTLPEDASAGFLHHNNRPLYPRTTDIHTVCGSELKAGDKLHFILPHTHTHTQKYHLND